MQDNSFISHCLSLGNQTPFQHRITPMSTFVEAFMTTANDENSCVIRCIYATISQHQALINPWKCDTETISILIPLIAEDDNTVSYPWGGVRLRFEVFTAVTMKNGIFWDVPPCGFFVACRLLVTASVVPSSPILVTLMVEALSSSETSFLTKATWCNLPEDAILQYYFNPIMKHGKINLTASNFLLFQNRSRDRSLSTVAGYELHVSGSIPWQGQDVFCFPQVPSSQSSSRPTSYPTSTRGCFCRYRVARVWSLPLAPASAETKIGGAVHQLPHTSTRFSA
jgi:hypothetical protein